MTAVGCTNSAEPPKTVVDQNTGTESPKEGGATGGQGQDAPKTETPEVVEPVSIAIEGSDLVEAQAQVTVNAPLDKARATVLKFEDYPQFMPEYSDAKRMGKLPSGNEKVYMEITTLGGIAKMYANVEVMPAATEGAKETHQAKFIDGNVKQFKATWVLTKVDEQHTLISLQVFLHPSIPLPDALINAANLDGAKKGVIAMKKRIEAAH